MWAKGCFPMRGHVTWTGLHALLRHTYVIICDLCQAAEVWLQSTTHLASDHVVEWVYCNVWQARLYRQTIPYKLYRIAD